MKQGCIREFVENDREALRAVYLETRRQAFHWLNDEFLRGDFDKDTEGETIWVCEESGTIAGFVSVWVRVNFIHHLFVLPRFSRLGHGSRLLEVCLNNIGRPARLKCLAANSGALEFYRSKGWRIVSEGVSTGGEYYLLEVGEI
ncbi:MAG: GNAT family N-acetyltransferase [Cellvibrionaceae bacterium]